MRPSEPLNMKDVSIKAEMECKTIGKNLRKLRLHYGMSQNDLAHYMKSDKSIISAIENGRCVNMGLITIIKIREVFKIKSNELFV